jgi:hypothetical protein
MLEIIFRHRGELPLVDQLGTQILGLDHHGRGDRSG